ncbi:hypothetical protein MRX96_003469 [Rhipicephalus microplus]
MDEMSHRFASAPHHTPIAKELVRHCSPLGAVNTQMLCCGVSGPADYAESVWKVEGIGRGDNVSKTCCRLRDEPDAHKNPQPLNETLCQNGDDRHSKGCLAGLEELVKREAMLMVTVTSGVAVLQIMGIIFSICLCKEL